MTIQIKVNLPDAILKELDQLVAFGAFGSRSDAVRAGVALVLAGERERAIDRAFAEGFDRAPDRCGDLAAARRRAVETVNAEIWEPWW